MIVLSIITLGIYIPIWFMIQRNAINKLKSKSKLSKAPFILILILFLISAILTIASFLVIDSHVEETIDYIDRWISFIGGVFVVVMSFKAAGIIEDHFNKTMVVAGVFFFGIFYLQYKLNEFI